MIKKIKTVIIGAGGFGREVYHIMENNESYKCIGFIDNNNLLDNLPAPIIGHESSFNDLLSNYSFSNCVIAIGEMKKRKKIFKRIESFSTNFPFIKDSSVRNYSENNINIGSILYPGVVIMNDCHIGKFTLINSGVTIGHDVFIGDFCNINPGVNLAGKIVIGDGTLIGIGACIKENINIGKNVVIGAGSVVIDDVPDNTTVYGVPAKTGNS